MIVYISAGTLIAIFIIALMGIFIAKKDNRKNMLKEEVVCAGSVDNSYPNVVTVKRINDPLLNNRLISQEEKDSLKRYVVKGNSMQYARINANDLIYVKEVGVDTIRNELPKVCLLMFSPKSPTLANRKIRRTWRIIPSDISNEGFDEALENVLLNDKFNELRGTMGTRCPSNDELKQIAKESLSRYRKTHSNQKEKFDNELLLSTTFRTEKDRLEFSIHPSSSLQGVVAYVSHPISYPKNG